MGGGGGGGRHVKFLMTSPLETRVLTSGLHVGMI